ncbi:MAG: DUF2202 domain-containing protein [Proteobacteria bacterium]|nr:DUF2202 domain-containing protein [Pseudomonadota bacterium]
MSGGILAWKGLVSGAEVDQGIFLIEGNETPEEVLSLAYGLEKGAHRFYGTLAEQSKDSDTRDLFERLAKAEIRHQETIWEKYNTLTGDGMTREAFEDGIVAETMEGGKSPDQVLADHPDWIRSSRDALELAMSLEIDALDLYLRMAQKSQNEEAKPVFYALVKEEKEHLRRLGELFRGKLSAS